MSVVRLHRAISSLFWFRFRCTGLRLIAWGAARRQRFGLEVLKASIAFSVDRPWVWLLICPVPAPSKPHVRCDVDVAPHIRPEAVSQRRVNCAARCGSERLGEIASLEAGIASREVDAAGLAEVLPELVTNAGEVIGRCRSDGPRIAVRTNFKS